jgi:hypothetical protein
MAEKHYTEFDCDYCKIYPCKRFDDKNLGKVIRYSCKDIKENLELFNLENRLIESRDNKNKAAKEQKFEIAAKFRDEELKIMKEIEKIKNNI